MQILSCIGILNFLAKIFAAIVAIFTPIPLNSRNRLTIVALFGFSFQMFEALLLYLLCINCIAS